MSSIHHEDTTYGIGTWHVELLAAALGGLDGFRDQNTFKQELRQRRLRALTHLFLIHRSKIVAVHYVSPTKGGRYPRWRRDGRELFFVMQDDQTEMIEFDAVDVEEADDGLKIGPPVKLSETRASVWNQFYDVTADGQRFLVPIRPDVPTRPIHIVADWKRSLAK